MATFRVTVRDRNQQPLSGAMVRLFNQASEDKLSTWTGRTPPVVTDTQGAFTFTFLTIGSLTILPPGQYTIEISKTGYGTQTQQTIPTFIGLGTFTFTLEEQAIDVAGYAINKATGDSVSALRPIPIAVTVPDVDQQQLITCEVTSQGKTSPAQIRPDETGVASFDIRSRVKLRPEFHAVPDDTVFATDPSFSGIVDLTFTVLTDTAEAGLNEGVILYAANFDPGLADVESYRSIPYKWITPLKDRLIAFKGFYADVLIWPRVTLAEEASMQLFRSDRNSLGQQIGVSTHDIPPGMFSVGLAAKVRVKSPSNSEVTYSEFTLRHRTTEAVLSEVLTVTYRD